MKVSLVGVQDMNFTSRDGNEINGVKVFIAYPDETHTAMLPNRNSFSAMSMIASSSRSKS